MTNIRSEQFAGALVAMFLRDTHHILEHKVASVFQLLSEQAIRAAACSRVAAPRNEAVAAWHKQTCPWGGCHPPRDGVELRPWPGWRESAACGERGESELCGSFTPD